MTAAIQAIRAAIVFLEGGDAYVVPTAHKVDGKWLPVVPILDTPVIMSAETQDCDWIFRNLVSQVKNTRGVQIEQVQIAFMGHQCSIQGRNLTARQVLSQILTQVAQQPEPAFFTPVHYAWDLLYDVNPLQYDATPTPRYWLSLRLIEGKAPVITQSAQPSTTASAPSTSANRAEVKK
jgi:hypothetical protein